MRGALVAGTFSGAILTAVAGGAARGNNAVEISLAGQLEKRCVVMLGSSAEYLQGDTAGAIESLASTLVSIVCNYPGATVLDVLVPGLLPLSPDRLQAEVNVLSRALSDGRSLITYQLTSRPLRRDAPWSSGAAAASLTPN